ncbi:MULTISPECIES: hypothetical protein [unclassified Shinella]|uniref:hypothetical protein n=1 Tax=unclassified Shinella TaxID=2643062 RepID=UPI00225D7A47|nr:MULTISPECIES: hypothetical protein [unclassified Shinella]MCO5140863.1 hypothetical protein [Shinella sp.]MDC7256447.1 hypothetical protein [Shinella sp. YE25]CAI0339315.1 conserved hypothetical protein [Rhizobiaceae bacterium]CAK7257723.1 conserved protein of unknown function [Shinella sp. WSC3-e]
MTIALSTIDKLGKLFPRLASDHDGEVVATARAIVRTLASAGATLHDITAEMQPKVRVQERVVYRDAPKPKPKASRKAKKASPPPEPPPQATRGKFVPYEEVLKFGPQLLELDLNGKEMDFVLQILTWAETYKSKFTLTAKQAGWWQRLLVENDVATPEGPAA